MAAGGGCAEGDAILCAQVHQGQGSGLCSEAHRLTFEKAVSREPQERPMEKVRESKGGGMRR